MNLIIALLFTNILGATVQSCDKQFVINLSFSTKTVRTAAAGVCFPFKDKPSHESPP